MFVAGMWFQDLWTYDFRRTEMCIIPYATQMGEISFCAYNTGVGWRQIVEKMYQNATRRGVVQRARQARGLREPAQAVPLPDNAQPVTLQIPKDGRLVEWTPRPARARRRPVRSPAPVAACAADWSSPSSATPTRTPPSGRRADRFARRDPSDDPAVRRRDCRRRPRRPLPGAPVDARSAVAARAPCREAAASGARSGVQGRRVERRDRRALLPERARSRAASARAASSRSSGCATSFRTSDNRDIDARVELGPAALPAGAVVPARSRPAREHAAARRPRRPASRCSTAARVDAAFELGDRAHRVDDSAGRAARETVDGALAGRRQRPRRPDPAPARADAPGRTHGANACWFRVATRGSRSTTGPTTRPGRRACRPAQRWLSTNHLMGAGYWVWLIPLGSGSTSVGIVADGDAASVQPDQPLRARARLAARVRAAVRRRRRGARGGRSRTFSRCSTSRTAARGCSRRTAGRWSARRASSPIRSIRPAPTSSPWATTTSPI